LASYWPPGDADMMTTLRIVARAAEASGREKPVTIDLGPEL